MKSLAFVRPSARPIYSHLEAIQHNGTAWLDHFVPRSATNCVILNSVLSHLTKIIHNSKIVLEAIIDRRDDSFELLQ